MTTRRLHGLVLGAALLSGCGDAFRTRPADPPAEPPSASPEAAPQGLLSMERIRMWDQAIRNLASVAAGEPALAGVMRSRPGEPPESLLVRLEGSAPLRDAIARAGLTTTQYMLVNTALFRALVTSYALEEGRITAIPPQENETDVRFVQRNGQEIRRIVQQTRMDLLPLVGEIGAPAPDSR
jgi:hypothetical protein